MGKLTALQVRNLTKPGVYSDGAGLALQVRSPNARSWVLRYMRAGRARWLGLGRFPEVSLAHAREAAATARGQLAQGLDPVDQRKAEQAAQAAAARRSFSEVAELYIASHEVAWRNNKHRQQWRNTLATYAFPKLGAMPVASLTTGDVLGVLQPIWRSKPETASRVRGRIEAVLSFARAMHWFEGQNPAAWRDNLRALLPAPNHVARVEHHAALPWLEIGSFMGELRGQAGVGAAALEFLILTAARSGEVRGATWQEIELGQRIWKVPAARMKAKREHQVPLSPAAIDVLQRMRRLASGPNDGNDFVFRGQKMGSPMSDMTLTAVLRRMKRGELTAHGFRSSFRDWCGEATNYPRELAEQSLAHTLRSKTEAAYARGLQLERRRPLMDDWAKACSAK